MSGRSTSVALALSCCLGLATAAAAQPISKWIFTQEFATELRARAKASGSTVTVARDLELRIKDSSGKEATAFLDNAYTEYSAHPEARAEVTDKYVQAFLEPRNGAAPIDRRRIVPVVKDRSWLAEIRESLQARGAKQPWETVWEDLNEDLVILYAEDSPRNVKYLSPKSLIELGLRKDQLRSLAVSNLRKLLPEPQITAGPLISMVTAGGSYEASLLLFDDLWSGGRTAVDGELIVAVPSRDVLLFTGSKNQAGIARLREAATGVAHEASYRLTDRLFVYRAGRFQRFQQ
jgi:uncharacterized protein YtpQ (UPF0354 family)